MKYRQMVMGIVLIGLATPCIATYTPEVIYKNQQQNYPAAEYPVYGTHSSDIVFVNEDKMIRKANKSYPEWYRGKGENGVADKDSHYSYTDMIAPSGAPIKSESVYMGTVKMLPGKTYPAHHHPAPETYYVISGEAEWFVNGVKQKVGPGDLMFHKPYDVHGWVNLSNTEELHLMYIWWKEPGAPDDLFNHGARFTNPDLFKSESDVKPHAVPLPLPAQKK
ncbi:dimethylsulfonioproprionate lyase family protein [Shewanella sp. 10N.286.52.B9]|uniref:dimethylsulfonioproprionate lyase family protein n=1 Tax=Shewanella sp. 10N.286.52.B9 TaxID=1880837 RepID=UPI000C836199|nr:dimethylsulfonioproprionate lyase family protein [Shewanella sp. 10N.286.52.B9]PMG45345.1 hypothetical protein BCU91_19760 [Shewanella sp. 10N.286.52.B9]